MAVLILTAQRDEQRAGRCLSGVDHDFRDRLGAGLRLIEQQVSKQQTDVVGGDH